MKRLGMALRLGALLAALLMLCMLASACGGEKPPDGKFDYTLVVRDFQANRWKPSTDAPTTSDTIWMNMMEELDKENGVKLDFLHVGPSELVQQMRLAVLAGDKFADIVIATQWAGGQMVAADLLADLNEVPANWDASWWNQNLRRTATIGDKTYLANGSFCFDVSMTWSIYFNRDIWDEVMPGVDPYDLVRKGEWTLEKFQEACTKAIKDLDGNGNITKADRWGSVTPGGDYQNAMFVSMGGHFFQTEGGRIKLALHNDKTINIVDKLHNLHQVKGAVNMGGENVESDGWAGIQNFFTDGKALFLVNMPGVPAVKDVDFAFGILPMPKFNKDAEYVSGVDHNASVMMMTNTNEDLLTVGPILDLLGEKGKELEKVYFPEYEVTFWRKGTEAVNQEMLDNYIAYHGEYDVGILLENVDDNFGRIPKGIVNGAAFGSGTSFLSTLEAQEAAIQAGVDAVIEMNRK